MQAYREF